MSNDATMEQNGLPSYQLTQKDLLKLALDVEKPTMESITNWAAKNVDGMIDPKFISHYLKGKNAFIDAALTVDTKLSFNENLRNVAVEAAKTFAITAAVAATGTVGWPAFLAGAIGAVALDYMLKNGDVVAEVAVDAIADIAEEATQAMEPYLKEFADKAAELGETIGEDSAEFGRELTDLLVPYLERLAKGLAELMTPIDDGLGDEDPADPDASPKDPDNFNKPEVENPDKPYDPNDPTTWPAFNPPTSRPPFSRENFSSPLVLDLNNNSHTSSSLIMSDTHFDLDGDSFAERTGWVEAEDGLLVIDKNQNGIIDNGSELFGNYSSNQNGQLADHGFDALTDYDTNSDGVIDSNDEVFDSLQVWVDENTDGQTQDGELHSLNELHINSINLNATSVNQEEKWNIISHESSFTQQVVDEDGVVVTDEDGNVVVEEKAVRDVWFANDRQDTTYQYDGEISSEIEALPEMNGMGRVMNLSHSMSEDILLQQQVETFLVSTGSDLTSLYEQADEILARWTHTDDIDPDEARGEQYVLNHNYSNPQTKYVFREYASAREVAILENFAGKLFQMTVNGQVTDQVLDSKTARSVRVKYDYLRDTLMINLLSQNLFGKAIYNSETASLQADALLTLQNTLVSPATSDELLVAVNLLSTLLNRDQLNVFNSIDPTILNNVDIQQQLAINGISLNLTNDEITGTIFDKTYGSSADDTLGGTTTLYGQAGNDTLNGTGTHDVLYGGDGNDILNGGAGSDILYGGDGNDTLNAGGSTYGHDILVGGAGDDLLVGNYRSSTYVYGYGDGHDTITDSRSIGTTPDVLIFNGLEREDIEVEKQGNDLILKVRAFPGFDYDFGSILIKNGFASGKIESFEFADQTLDFNQLLHGSTVYDTTHSYGLEQGRVVIHDTGGIDTLTFGEGIVSTDIIAQAEADNDNFLIGIKEEGVAFGDLTHIITIQGGLSTATAIESFIFVDGTTLDFNGLLQLQDGTVGDDYLRFANANDTVDGLTGNDTIITGAGDDTLFGGLGDDTLFGGLGDDRYVFNRGDGRDLIVDHVDAGQGFAGNDSLVFGEGINPDEMIGLRQGNDILLAIKEAGVEFSDLHDQITLRSWYESSERVENVVFADGTVWGTSEILSSTVGTGILYGLDGDDVITGNEEDNVIFARGGDDTISGLGGNDSLYGEDGNDILIGNGGNDQLEGGQGDDIYRFNRGDGHDVIIDGLLGDFNDNGIDTLVFGSSVSSADLIVQRQGTDMVVALRQDGVAFTDLVDSMILKNWYEAKNRIEYFQFADDSQLTAGELLQFIQADDGEEIVGLETDSVFGNGPAGNSYIGKEADDVYHFATGNGRDTLTDSGGFDRIVIGDGTAPADLCITWLQGSDDIVLSFSGNEDDELILKGWYSDQGRIESIEFRDGTVWDGSAIIDALGTDAEDVFVGLKGVDNTIYARGGDDIVSTFDGDDILHGGDGADGLDAQQGDDTLLGDAGDDQLWGGAGDDVYIFNRGDGQDLIFDDDKFVADAGNDTVRFGVGITKADLIFKVNPENNDLYIGIIDPASPDTPFDELSDTITISNWYLAKNRIENIELTETGEVLDVAAVMAAMGTDSDDVIKALSEGSVLDGQLGNDILYGNVGDDVLAGSGGDDILEGGTGDDRLAGGVGNDLLKGEGGADTYQFGRGDGNDTVYDSVTTSYYQYGWVTNEVTGYQRWGKVLLYRSLDGGEDTVQFGDGVVSDDLLVRTTGNDITIAIKEDGKVFDELSDQLTITDFYNTENKIEHFTFSDGQVLAPQEILNLMFTEVNDNVTFETDSGQIIFAKGSDDTVIGGNGNDQITGGSGNDLLNGAKGDDTYLFGQGDGQDIVEDNGQLAWWQLGNGQDTIHIQGGLTLDDVVIAWGGTLSAENKNDVVIAIREDGIDLSDLADRIVVKDWFNRQTKVEVLTFDDGTTLDGQSIMDAVFTDGVDFINISEAGMGHVFKSRDGDDTIIASNSVDSVYAGEGSDIVFGKGGADRIEGGAGNDFLQGDDEPDYNTDGSGSADSLYGGSGADVLHGAGGGDTLVGGMGNDHLYGGGDNDAYLFSRGEGVDTVEDRASFDQTEYHYNRFGQGEWLTVKKDINGGSDTLQFGEGITADNVIFYWDQSAGVDGVANDLIVALKDPDNADASIDELTDKIILKDWFYRTSTVETKVAPPEVVVGDGEWDAEYGENIMTGDYVQTAVSADGTLGFGSRSNPGIKHDPTGTGSFGVDDYLTPGSPWEIFSIKSAETGIRTNNNASSDSITTDSLLVIDEIAPYDHYIRWIGHYGDYFSIQTDYYFNDGDERINMTTKITALSDLGDVSFLRSLDPDPDVKTYGSYSTVNGRGFDANGDGDFDDAGDLSPEDWVHSEGTSTGLTIGLYSDSNYIHNTGVSSSWSSNPETYLQDAMDGNGDYTIGLAFDFGDLINGQEVSFDYAYVMGDTLATADLNDEKWPCDPPVAEYSRQVENFSFADGSILNGHDLLAAMQSENDDRLEAVVGEDSMIYGLAGNDLINGDTGNDQLYGGEGDDRLTGGFGVNVLDGGSGDDTFVLAAENEPSWYDRAASDTITDEAGADKVLFLGDVARENIVFSLDGSDLLISYGLDLQHSARITGNSVERFETSDGSFISREELLSAFNAMADASGKNLSELIDADIASSVELKAILYQAWNDGVVEHHGSDAWEEFTGNSENEMVFGEGGHDVLLGNSGNDILSGGADDDVLNGGNGDDSYIFNRGDNNDTIFDWATTEFSETSSNVATCSWQPAATPAPSDDSLVLQGDISQQDLETYWVSDNDLLIKVNPADGAPWNDRITNVETVLTHYNNRNPYERVQNEDSSWSNVYRDMDASDLEGFSDKALRHLAYMIDTNESNSALFLNEISSIHLYLQELSQKADFFEDYRAKADSIMIQQFYDSRYSIENIVLEDGNITLDHNDIIDMMSTDNSEMIRGVDWADNIINAFDGNDIIIGGALDDTITGGGGDDLINSGTGDDIIHFGSGDGHDQIFDIGGVDTLVMGEGLTYDNTQFERVGDDVLITLEDGSTTIIKDWGLPDNKIEKIRLGDGNLQDFDSLFVLRAKDYNLIVAEDSAIGGTIKLTNAGSGVVYSVSKDSDRGNFIVNTDGSWSYAPDQDFNGSEQIVVSIFNDAGEVTTSIINLSITPVNDLPVISQISPVPLKGVLTATGVLSASDIDGDILDFSVSSVPQHGIISIDEQGNWLYTAEDGYYGYDQAMVTVDDGNGGTVVTSIEFIVNVYETGDWTVPSDSADGIMLNGISKDDLQLTRDSSDLHITVQNRGAICLQDYFLSPEISLSYLETMEGPLHLAKDVIDNLEPGWCDWFFGGNYQGEDGQKDLIYGVDSREQLSGNGENDVIFGADGNDSLYGDDGDDTLIGGNGCDVLQGDDGDDTLYGDADGDDLSGGDGNDALIGGDGNDDLAGGSGSDRLWGDAHDDDLYGGGGDDLYLFNKGDGRDFIHDTLRSGFFNMIHEDAGNDTVLFGTEVVKEDVAFYMGYGDLYLQYGDNDVIKIDSQSDVKDKIEIFKLADDSYLTDADINQLIQDISSFAVKEGISINSVSDVRQNEALMTLVAESWHK